MPQKYDNYALAAQQARARFLTYDQSAIAAKSPVTLDETYLYLKVLNRPCRIHRQTGIHAWRIGDTWQESLAFNETLTIFDYLCDAKTNRRLTGEYMAMSNFGLQFHSGLLEQAKATPLELAIDHDPGRLRRACTDLGGVPFPKGDAAYVLPLFPDLPIAIQFWHSDEDFPPQLRYFWDKASLDYLRYETMFYAVGIVTGELRSKMGL